ICAAVWSCLSAAVAGGDRGFPPAGLVTCGAGELAGDGGEAVLTELDALRQALPADQVHDHLRGLNRIARLSVAGLFRPLAGRARGAGVVPDPRLSREEAAAVEKVRAEGTGLDR